MSNIKESAEAYVPPETKNITDLKKIPVNLDVVEETFKEGTADEYTSDVITVDEQKYRVPKSVLAGLKLILSEKPDLEFFKVVKDGTGMNTLYQVIPL